MRLIMMLKRKKSKFLFCFFITFLLPSNIHALFCSNVMKEKIESCQSLICNDQLSDDFFVQREILGKERERCQYREIYKKYNFSVECNFNDDDIKKILDDFLEYGGPWISDYEQSCKPVFAPIKFRINQKNNILKKIIEQNILNIYEKHQWDFLKNKNLNFLSSVDEIKDKRGFLYSYSVEDFAMRNTVKDNIVRKLDELQLFISKILANRQNKIIENYSQIIENHISFIKYLYSSIITLNSVINIDNHYMISLNDANLNMTNRKYKDFMIKVFDRDSIEIHWNIRYFDRVFSLYKNDFFYIDDNHMQHTKHNDAIVINLENQTFHIKLRANQTFDPMQMQIVNGIPNYKVVKKKFDIKDFIKEDKEIKTDIDKEYEEKMEFLQTLVAEITFDIYDLDKRKSFVEDVVVKKLLSDN